MKNFILTILLLIIIPKILLPQENIDNNIDMLLLKGKYQEVINLLEPLTISCDTLSAKNYYKLGIAYRQFYKQKDAVKMFSIASRMESNNSTFLYAFAQSLLNVNNKMLAYVVLKETIEKDQNNISAKIEYGKIALDLLKFDEAENVFLTLTKLDSTNSYFFQKLAYCYLKNGEKENAVKNYKKSIELFKYDPIANLQLATIYFKDKNYEEAYKLLTECFKENSLNISLNRLMAEVVFQMKKYKASIMQYEHLISIGDSTDLNYQKLGFSFYFVSQSNFTPDSLRNNKLNFAVENLLKAKSLNELDPITSLYLGICYKELKEYDIAIIHLVDCTRLLFPSYTSDVFTHLGACYEFKKDFSNAINNYLNAYEFNQDKKSLLFSIASTMDQFYADREIPIIYYKTFLNEYEQGDQNLINYAKQRIEKLTEENHFLYK